MTDAIRLAVGTLTAVPVPAPRAVTPRLAGRAMAMAPLVGLLLGGCAELLVLVVRSRMGHPLDAGVAAVVAVAFVAVATRGIHLDGLADTVDAVGSGRTGADGLVVMRRSDVGPFGVTAIVLVLLLDVTGLAAATLTGRGTLALAGGLLVSRLSITWAARTGVPAARPDGLGAAVAGTVAGPFLAGATVVSAAALTAMTVLDDDLTLRFVPKTLLAAGVALVVGQLAVAVAVRRFGGITGDVLGAAAELTGCAFVLLVVLA